jgi:hypothetical protein
MKLSAPLAKTLLMAASIGLVVPVLAQTPRPANPPAKGTGTEEEPEVIGVVRPWAGGLMGLAVEGNAFVLRFYDAEKKPVPPAAARATVRWDPTNKAGQQRAVLNPGGPDSLRSPSVVRPPLAFAAFITLLDAEGNSLGGHSFDLRELK